MRRRARWRWVTRRTRRKTMIGRGAMRVLLLNKKEN